MRAAAAGAAAKPTSAQVDVSFTQTATPLPRYLAHAAAASTTCPFTEQAARSVTFVTLLTPKSASILRWTPSESYGHMFDGHTGLPAKLASQGDQPMV